MKQRSSKKQSRRGSNIPRQIGAGDVILKRMTLGSQSVSTTAGSIIAVTTSVTSSLVQSAPAAEWASFAARYQQYRVKSVKIRVLPIFPVNNGGAGLAPNTGHSQLYVGDYIGSSTPATAAQVLSDEGALCHSTSKPWSFTATSRRNPNALLWNPTSASVPTANQFGICWASSTVATAMAGSTPYLVYDVEWIVEFRGSQ